MTKRIDADGYEARLEYLASGAHISELLRSCYPFTPQTALLFHSSVDLEAVLVVLDRVKHAAAEAALYVRERQAESRAAEAVVDARDEFVSESVFSDDLPGMWEASDLSGGESDSCRSGRAG